jgi:predicted N-acyltransferase
VSLSARVHGSIADIGREAWDAHASLTGDPFLSYDFLEACEASGCAQPRQGWAPRHLTLEDDGAVVGVMPLYLKGNSQGEYVFDHAWADAYERGGGQYYPKLLSAVPFTPVTGQRLLAATPEHKRALLGAAVNLTEREGLSSLHVNFADDADQGLMTGAGLLPRQDRQFIWENDGYATFEDFLSRLSSSRRKTIRRERREAKEGIDIRVLTGADITEDAWDAFFNFYLDTGSRKWGRPYLNRLFFSLVGERMADRIALIMAHDDARPIAGALNFIGRDALYGRQWGALEARPFLHFELCYYRAIDFAIERGLPRVEAGAQGEHKLARGYLPKTVHSAHFIAHGGLRDAVERYLEQERRAVAEDNQALIQEFSPFRRGEPSP